jgi:hypothetical protein
MTGKAMADSDGLARPPRGRSIGTMTLGAIALVSGLITIVLGIKTLWDLEGPGWAIVLAWFVSAMVVLSLVTLLAQQVRHANRMAGRQADHEAAIERLVVQQKVDLQAQDRSARYATAFPLIHESLHLLRDAAVAIDRGAPPEAIPGLISASLKPFSRAFDVITGSPTRACVKVLTGATDAPETVNVASDQRYLLVSTFARDSGSNPPGTSGPDPLTANTDFLTVWDPNQPGRCFFSNDLDKEQGYLNPHRPPGQVDPDYNATIVWPIQKKWSDIEIDLWGYLCIDSRQRGCFARDLDFEVGAAIADTLYTVLSLIDLRS